MRPMASSNFCCGRAASPTRRMAVVTTLVTTFCVLFMACNNAVEAHSSLLHRSLKQDELLTIDDKKMKISNDVKFIIFDDDSWMATTTSTTDATMAASVPSSSLTTISNNNVVEPTTLSIPSPATTAISTASATITEAKILSSAPTPTSSLSYTSTTSDQFISKQPSSFIITQVPTTTTHVTTTKESLQPSTAPLLSTSSTTIATAASKTFMAPTSSLIASPSNSVTESPTMIQSVTSTTPTVDTVSPIPSPANTTEVPSSISSSEVSSTSPSVQSSNDSSSSSSRNNGSSITSQTPSTDINTKESTIPTVSSSQAQSLTQSPTIAMMIGSVQSTTNSMMTSSSTEKVDTEMNESSSPVSTSISMVPTAGVVTSLSPSSSEGVMTSQQQPSLSVPSSATVMSSSPSIISSLAIVTTSLPTTPHPSKDMITSTPSKDIMTSQPASWDQVVVPPSSQSPSPEPTEELISTPPSSSTVSSSTTSIAAKSSTSTSSTVIMTSPPNSSALQNNDIDSNNSMIIISCPEGTCPNPNNICEAKVECFIDPCDNASCVSGICQVNYCGGCHAICAQDDNDSMDTVFVMNDGETLTQHPSTNPTVQPSKFKRPSKKDEELTTEDEVVTITTTSIAPTLNSTLPKVQVPKLTFTLIETLGILSTQALEDVLSSIETFLTTQFDDHYNDNGNKTFAGISLKVVDDVVVARAAPDKDDGDGRRSLQSGVLIGTEISISGEADFIQEPQPSSADIVGKIIQFGERYNYELISSITSSGNSELNDVFLVEVGNPSSSSKGAFDESFIEQTLPEKEDGEGVDSNNNSGGSSTNNIISGLKTEKMDSDRYNQFIVIAAVTGVATLTFLMFAFTSRDHSSHLHRNSRRSAGRDPVTVPISVLASGSRSRSRSSMGNGSKEVEEEEVGSDPYIKCHKKGDSYISDLTTLASQPFARIVRSQSELDKDLESFQTQPNLNSLSGMEREYVRKTIICDEEEGHFVNNRCNTREEDHYFTRVKSCYTQDYSGYYNNSRSCSQEERELPNNTGMVMDRSYLHAGWHASSEGGFWSSLNDYHRKSMESSIEESVSLPASGSIKRSESQPSEGGSDSAQLSEGSCGSRRQLCQASTPAASNISTFNCFQRDVCVNEDNSIERIEHHHSTKQAALEASDHHSDTSSSSNHDNALSEEWLSAMHGKTASMVSSNSNPCLYLDQVTKSFESSSLSPRNNDNVALSEEWLTAMHGEGASITSVQRESLQYLNRSTSLKSEDCTHTSSLAENDVLPKEWLTALHGDGASVVSSHADSRQYLDQTKSKSSEYSTESPRNEVLSEECITHGDVSSQHSKPSCNKGCGGFLSSFDCGSGEEEEESDQFTNLQHEKKSNRTTNEDAFSATSSERDEPQVEEREINMRDSADLLSLVDTIVGPSQVSLVDLVWLEERIREKGVASKKDIASKDIASNSEVKRGVEDGYSTLDE